MVTKLLDCTEYDQKSRDGKWQGSMHTAPAKVGVLYVRDVRIL